MLLIILEKGRLFFIFCIVRIFFKMSFIFDILEKCNKEKLDEVKIV